MEKNLLKHDKYGSSFGWRILVNPAFDYRKNPEGKFVVEGYSKWMQMPEVKNKTTVLLDSVSMLFEKRWVFKADGILVYQSDKDIMIQPLEANKRILYLRPLDGLIVASVDREFIGQFACLRIEAMVDHYNRGNQRGVLKAI